MVSHLFNQEARYLREKKKDKKERRKGRKEEEGTHTPAPRDVLGEGSTDEGTAGDADLAETDIDAHN